MGKLAREKEGDALTRIVRDYPLSVYAEPAKKRLKELEMAIPEADPRAVARMKWEQENRTKVGLMSKSSEFLKRGPDVSKAAKSGSPTMTNPKQNVPLSVPVPANTAATTAPATGVNDVTIAPVATGNSALDTKPDARATLKTDPSAPATPAAADPTAPAATPAPASSTATPATAKPDATATPDASKNKKKNKKKTDKTTKTDQTKTTASQE